MARRYTDPELLGTLELWIVNRTGEIENANWRKRHAHEPHYIEQKAVEVEMMQELSGLLRLHIERRKEAAE